MKKLFTLITLLAVTLTASAQLTFCCNDKEIANGSTFATDTADPTFTGYGFVKFTPHICVKNASAGNVTVKVRSLTDKKVDFCFGGNCVPVGSDFTVKQADVEAGIAKDLEVDAGGMGVTGTQTYKAEIVAYETGKEDEAISMTLIMTNDVDVLSVGNVETAKENVTVNNRTLSYSFASAKTRTISLYTATGQTVASWTVYNATGTISLDTMKLNGTYIYNVAGTDISGKVQLR